MKLATIMLVILFIAGCGGDEPTPKPPKPPVPTTVSVKIGTPALDGHSYRWSPAAGLDDVNIAQPTAQPKCTTEYEVSATNQCGVAKSKTVVHVFKKNSDGELVEVKCGEVVDGSR